MWVNICHTYREQTLNIFGENSPRLSHVVFESVALNVEVERKFRRIDFEWNVVQVEGNQRRTELDGPGRFGPQRSVLSANRFAAFQVAVTRLLDLVQQIGLLVFIWKVWKTNYLFEFSLTCLF
jgi:hypothetical protein